MKEKTTLLKNCVKGNINWEGDNFFFLNKKIITGPLSFKSIITTFTTSIIPFILLGIFNFEVCISLFIKFRFI